MKRKSTIIGKIQVIKTFLISQFVFLFQSIILPANILDEINTIFYRFIWRKDHIDKRGWERIGRKILSNSKKNGGLEMINMIDFQSSFLLKWGCDLNNGKDEVWKSFPIHIFKKVGGLSIFNSNIEYKKMKGIEEIKSPFWRKVLQIWLENKAIDENITSFDNISNNKLLTVNNKPLFVKNALINNVLYVRDMLKENGDIISFEEYNEKVGTKPSNMINYVTIKTEINKIKNKIIKTEEKQVTIFKDHSIEELDRKKIYQLLMTDEPCPSKKVWEK